VIDALDGFGGARVEERLVSLLRIEEFWRRIDSDFPDAPPFVAAAEWVTPALVEVGGAELCLRGLLEALGDSRESLRGCVADELGNVTWCIAGGSGLTVHDSEDVTDAERGWLVAALRSALDAEEHWLVQDRLAGALRHLEDNSWR
jgi:hypothetical protein